MCAAGDGVPCGHLDAAPARAALPEGTRAAPAMVGLLDEAARFDNERDALFHMADVFNMLRSERFRDIATCRAADGHTVPARTSSHVSSRSDRSQGLHLTT